METSEGIRRIRDIRRKLESVEDLLEETWYRLQDISREASLLSVRVDEAYARELAGAIDRERSLPRPPAPYVPTTIPSPPPSPSVLSTVPVTSVAPLPSDLSTISGIACNFPAP